MSERLDRVLDQSFVADLAALPIEDLRRRRSEFSEVETSVSFVRRLAQGRLDILVADLQRRAVGDGTHRIDDLIEQLSEILAGTRGGAPGSGRFPALMAPDPDDELVAELDAVLPDRSLGDLTSLSDEQALALGESLRDFERQVSDQRRTLHSRMALVEAELVRRYKAGEASVDSLLTQ